MDENLKEQLKIRCLKACFTVSFPEGGELPEHKASALRGGMGEMLLQMHCISDRNCEECSFTGECTVQRTMYSQMEITPPFMGRGDSVGYVLECDDPKMYFERGEELNFQLLLFGKTIVHLKDFLRAFIMLGGKGIGKNRIRFQIKDVSNSQGQQIYDGKHFKTGGTEIFFVSEYVESRLKETSGIETPEYELRFQSPVSIKKDKEILKELQLDAILWSARRRLYILNCFEGLEMPYDSREMFVIPQVLEQKTYPVSVRRFSTRSGSGMVLNGLEGSIRFRNIKEDVLALLYAGELNHIGKSSSFGFGKYRIKEVN